jgi:hypothetical protein
MPYNLLTQLREYKIKNVNKYRDAMEVTGPIDGSSLYQNVKAQRDD